MVVNLMKQIIIQQVYPPPILFFTMHLYTYFNIQIHPYQSTALFAIGVLFMLLFKCNHFFMYCSILNDGLGVLSLANMILGLLAINQKWKGALFFFILGQWISKGDRVASLLYMVLCSLIIGILTYKNLIFKTLDDNRIYFIGFMLIFSIQIFKIFLKALDLNQYYIFIWIPLGLITFNTMFDLKIHNLKQSAIQQIKSPQIAFHFIELLKNNFDDQQNQYRLFSQFQKNNRNGLDIISLALNKKGGQQKDYYFKTDVCDPGLNQAKDQTEFDSYKCISNLFQTFLQRRGKQEWRFLFNKYINFKLDYNRISEAMIMNTTISNVSPSVFNKIDQLRIKQKIKQMVTDVHKRADDGSNYYQFFEYDQHYLKIAKQIGQIIYKKQVFWIQVAKKQPKMQFLQQKGLQITAQMEKLHQFYQRNIKQQEKQYQRFNGTILYSFYLKFGTSFTKKADEIIQTVATNLQAIKISTALTYDSYGIQTKLKHSCEFTEIQNQTKNKFTGFVIILATSSFAKAMETSKNHLIEKDISFMIPQIYRPKHNQAVRNLFDFKQSRDFHFISKSIQVPMQLPHGKIVQTKISTKIFTELSNEVCFISIIRKIGLENDFILYKTLENKNVNNNIRSQILQQNQIIKKHLLNISQCWLVKKQFNTFQTAQTIKDKQLKIIISSPFQKLFLYPNPCPIHINIKNDNLYDVKQDLKTMNQLQVVNCIQNVQNNAINGQNGNQSQAAGSIIDSRSSAIAILLNYLASNHLPFYTYFWLLFFLFMMACVAMNVCMYNYLNLPWNITEQKYNPFENMSTIYAIQRQVISISSFFQDIQAQATQKLPDIKTSFSYAYDINRLFQSISSQMENKFSILRTRISEKLAYTSFLFQQTFKNDIYTRIVHIGGFSTGNGEFIPSQNTSVKTVLMNYIADAYILSQNYTLYSKTLIPYTFVQSIQPIIQQVQTKTKNIFYQTLDEVKKNNIICMSCLIFITIVFVCPIHALYKTCYQKVEWVYQLMVSVDSEQIKSEVYFLEEVKDLIQSSNNAAQIIHLDEFTYFQKNNDCLPKGIYEHFTPLQLTFKKRVAQLAPNDNQRGKAMICLLLFFIPFLLGIVLTKVNLIQNIRFKSKDLFHHQQIILKQALLLLNTKKLMDYGQTATYNNLSVKDWVKTQLDNIDLNYLNENYKSSFELCASSSYFKICSSQFSQSVLTGLLQQYIRKGYLAVTTNMNTNKKMGIRIGLLYAQTILSIKYQTAQRKLIQVKSQIYSDNDSLNYKMYDIVIGVFVWMVISFIVSNVSVRTTGLKYIQELKVLSFVSEKMVVNNKRIQSFMNKLAKQSY